MALVEGPPEPTIRPVRGLEMSFSVEAGIGDGLVHRHPAIARAVALEAAGAAVHHLVEIDLQAAMHLGAEAQADIILRRDNAGSGLRAGTASLPRHCCRWKRQCPGR